VRTIDTAALLVTLTCVTAWGHIWTRPGLQDFANNSASEKDCEHISGLEVRVVTLGP
jgi:hypothetical protein